ncbi:cholecystokinin-like [Carassius auratus]|uniref:Cholecystokinin-like n=1 Tax=Carassius auratus TaxID=7957 RepID=A0A6P6RKH6_CARAU|nr:cholecystokinin-like [Carassius auratus]XP_052440833.1 cholecystokinin [Carassius gibelio]XP_059412146.1 cholecystokinin [Carassius carassius]
MNSGVCVCLILAALSASCLGRPRSSSSDTDDSPLPSQLDASLSGHHRVARSTSLTLKQQPADTNPDTRANLSQLLAKLMSKKGSVHRSSSMNNRANSINHRIKDRDYVGWMDFGRRSAEEYEYSS